MPIIISTVPNSVTKQKCDQVRESIKVALEKEGVSRNETTVEFLIAAFPERLVINYKSHSSHLRKSGQRYREAEIVGKVIEHHFEIPVECLVTILKREDTGIYLTEIQ